VLNATQPPRRMRFSFESRCRLVSLVCAGQSPQAAAAACGASRATGYRLWRRYQEGGWAALADRPPVPKHQPRRLSRELEQRILAARDGIAIERVLSDNGNGYRSHAWAAACAELGIARRHTRSRRPQTNGKAEALVKTLLREWAYRFAYPTSTHRSRALPGYLRWYNLHRPHASLGGRPPISRVSQVCGSHI
jgi:transposase InsO family protein